MSTQFQIASMLSSIAFMVLVGSGFIVILTVPALSQKPIYPMIILTVISLIITPVIGWIIATKIQNHQNSRP